jgi:hypothetical protein
MKVIDKQLLFISSDERDSGTSSDFHLSLPSHLLTCRQNQRMRLVLNDVVMPYTFYNVQDSNRHFDLVENGVTTQAALDVGSYHAIQLRDHLKNRLDHFTTQSYTYTVGFSEVDSRFTITIDSPTGVNQINFGSNSAYKLLGFEKGSTNQFNGSTLLSTKAVSIMYTDALYLHCDLLNTNVDKRAGAKEVFHLSTAFAKIPINTSPFSNIIFSNHNDDYMLNLIDRRVAALHFWVTTAEHGIITLNDDFSFTLKVEVLQDDEKTLVDQNMGLAELLRLLVLQNRVTSDRNSGD